MTQRFRNKKYYRDIKNKYKEKNLQKKRAKPETSESQIQEKKRPLTTNFPGLQIASFSSSKYRKEV
jgi:hypothetical protein